MAESGAICEYIEETRKEPPLMPADAAGRYEVRRLLGWFDDKFHNEVTSKLLYERVNKKVMKQGYPDSGNVKAGAKAIKYHLDYMAWLLDHRRWLAGGRDDPGGFRGGGAFVVTGLHIGCGLEPTRGGQGLVCEDQVAARVPVDPGGSVAGAGAAATLCGP